MTLAHPEIHLFEPSGYAGVFQHACRLAEILHRSGRRVVLHTGHDHEDVDVPGVDLCRCSWWPRRAGAGRAATAARRILVAARFTGRTLPHLHRTVPRGAVLHVQGIAAAGALTLLALRVGRLRSRRVAYSPHDTFSRWGAVDGAFLRLASRAPHALVVHSRADVEHLRLRRLEACLSPLVQLVPPPSDRERLRWRQAWQACGPQAVVLFAGFIRPEKRLDVLVESARSWPVGRRLAVVGEDRGDWDRCRELARAHGVDIVARVGFVELVDFVAAIAAADLVVVPSEQASQSGVLAVARQLGTPTLAADVGGLPDLASGTFAAGDPEDLNRAIDAQLTGAVDGSRRVRTAGSPSEEDLTIRAHLRAYGQPA